jgi:hypothetical protein
LDDTLVSVLENRPANCEILVFHNRPYHDPYELAGEVRFFEVDSRTTLADCLNLALRASRSPVVHVVTCGVEVFPGWADAAMRHFRDPEVAAVAAVVVDRDDCRKVVSAGLGYRAEGEARRLGQGGAVDEVEPDQDGLCGPDLLAAFYCKSTLQEVGGFSRFASDTLTGIDAWLAVRRAGFRCVLEPGCRAKVDAASIKEQPRFRLGHDSERLFWRWASTHGWARSLLGHAALTAGECVLGLWRVQMAVHLAGRAWGVGRWMLGPVLSQDKRHREPATLLIGSRQHASDEESEPCRDSARAA